MKNGVAASCCEGAFCRTSLHKIDDIMRKNNYVDILKQHVKTSVRKLKPGRKWVFQMYNDPKHTSEVVAKWLKESQGIGVAITKSWPQTYRKCVGRTEKVCASKEAYKPDSDTPALLGGMGQKSPKLLWEACGRLPEMFEMLNNLKGQCFQILIECM